MSLALAVEYDDMLIQRLRRHAALNLTTAERGRIVHELRVEHGWNAQQVADAVGIRHSTVWSWLKAADLVPPKRRPANSQRVAAGLVASVRELDRPGVRAVDIAERLRVSSRTVERARRAIREESADG